MNQTKNEMVESNETPVFKTAMYYTLPRKILFAKRKIEL